MTTSATNNKFNQLASLVLSSPQGLLAVVVAIGSAIALACMLLFRSASQASNKSSSRSKSHSTRSSPTKQQSSVKKSPLKKSVPTSVSPKKETPSKVANNSGSGKSSSGKKAAGVTVNNSDRKANSSTKAAATTKQKQSNGSQKSSQNKDDGEWITVSSKKKAVRTKKTVDEAPSAPQTRMSTRRSNQNSQTPRRA